MAEQIPGILFAGTDMPFIDFSTSSTDIAELLNMVNSSIIKPYFNANNIGYYNNMDNPPIEKENIPYENFKSNKILEYWLEKYLEKPFSIPITFIAYTIYTRNWSMLINWDNQDLSQYPDFIQKKYLNDLILSDENYYNINTSNDLISFLKTILEQTQQKVVYAYNENNEAIEENENIEQVLDISYYPGLQLYINEQSINMDKGLNIQDPTIPIEGSNIIQYFIYFLRNKCSITATYKPSVIEVPSMINQEIIEQNEAVVNSLEQNNNYEIVRDKNDNIISIKNLRTGRYMLGGPNNGNR